MLLSPNPHLLTNRSVNSARALLIISWSHDSTELPQPFQVLGFMRKHPKSESFEIRFEKAPLIISIV